jgi:hypothetical protein
VRELNGSILQRVSHDIGSCVHRFTCYTSKEAATRVRSLVFEHRVEGLQVRIICANALHTQSITTNKRWCSSLDKTVLLPNNTCMSRVHLFIDWSFY